MRIAPIGVGNFEPVDHNSMLGVLLIFDLHSYPPAAPVIFIKRYDRLFDQIDEAVDQLDWAVVQDRAQTVLTLNPGNADAIPGSKKRNSVGVVFSGHIGMGV